MTLVQAHDVGRTFGDFTAVEAVTMAVEEGEVVGLLGANGAGKTTLIRMLLGVLAPSSGTVQLMGGPPSRATRHDVGYVPQGLGLYADLTVAENVAFHRAAFHPGATRPGADGAAHAQIDDDVAEDVLVGALSTGQQRRLALAIAMAHAPSLLVLDEPSSGVGPLERTGLWDQIHAAADAGVGVLVTTHHMSEAEQCDRLVIMAAGRVVAAGPLDQVLGSATSVAVRTTDLQGALAVLGNAGMVAALAPDGVAVVGTTTEAVAAVLAAAAVEATVAVRRATLEERFVELAAT